MTPQWNTSRAGTCYVRLTPMSTCPLRAGDVTAVVNAAAGGRLSEVRCRSSTSSPAAARSPGSGAAS